MARPRKELDAEQVAQVEKLAAVLTQEQIADFLGMSDRTLRRRFNDDPRVLSAYEKGKANAIAGVATNLMQQARNGNVTAAIFYLKTQAGWKETTTHEHTGKDGGPIETVDYGAMTVEQLERLRNGESIASVLGGDSGGG